MLKLVDDIDVIDVIVDGVDEVDFDFNGIKGGGGVLFMEKIVVILIKEYIWVVDESKFVEMLGVFKLFVEVVRYGFECFFWVFKLKGYCFFFCEIEGDCFIIDMGNYIIDLDLKKIEDLK